MFKENSWRQLAVDVQEKFLKTFSSLLMFKENSWRQLAVDVQEKFHKTFSCWCSSWKTHEDNLLLMFKRNSSRRPLAVDVHGKLMKTISCWCLWKTQRGWFECSIFPYSIAFHWPFDVVNASLKKFPGTTGLRLILQVKYVHRFEANINCLHQTALLKGFPFYDQKSLLWFE